MLNSGIRQVIFLIILFVGLCFGLSEGQIGQYREYFMITGKYVFPFFLLVRLSINRQWWPNEKKKYVIESLRDAGICAVTVMTFLPTINRVLPPSTDYLVEGKVIDIKPEKAGCIEINLKQKNGKLLNLTIPRSQYPTLAANDFFTLKVKRGGLGLLYGPKE
jgi:hypothetical protein